MKRLLLPLLVLIGLLAFSDADAQKVKTIDVDVQVTYAKHLGTTPPVRELVPTRVIDPEKKKKVKMDKEAPLNAAGRNKRPVPNPNALPQGPDPVWQKSFSRTPVDGAEILVNVEGIRTQARPLDPTGEIGLNYYLQAVNATLLAVYDKQGNLAASPFAANTIWNAIGFSSSGDPIVMFDQEFNRWIITEFPSGNQLLVAISKSDDPLGAWDAYNFGTPTFPDYPKYSIWKNSIVVTTNEEGAGSLPSYFIDRQALLNTEATVPIQRIVIPGIPGGPGFQVASPVDWTGSQAPTEGTAPMVVRLNDDAWGESPVDQIDIYSIDLDFENPDNTVVTVQGIPTAPYDTDPCVGGGGFTDCIPQLNGGTIDGLREVIMHQVHYRNFESHETMIMNFITDVTGGNNLAGIRWIEFRRNPGEAEWSLYQEGTFAPDDGLHRFMGSLAMDGNGNIALAYTVSSEEIHPGLRFTGRRASDPLGEMTIPECVVVEGTNVIGSSRFGDYAHMSIDPEDDRTFWFTAEYAGGGGNDATTRVLAFNLSRDTFDVAATGFLAPASGPDLTDAETVTVRYRNVGIDTIDTFEVGYVFEDNAPVIDTVNQPLLPDSVYEHTFMETVDLSALGFYNLSGFVSAENDVSNFNDTVRVVIQNIPRFDIGITNVANAGPSLSCTDSTLVAATVTNFGANLITAATITYTVNGVAADPILWTGELPSGESVTFEFTVNGLIQGDNEIAATSSLPNGETDQEMGNDTFSRIIAANPGGATFFINILADNFPEETTWEVADEDGTVLFTGGPYQGDGMLFVDPICIDPESCYTFTIFDAFGDGICCGYGEGQYSITNAEGQTFTVGGEFGLEESVQFCGTFMCMLDAEISASPTTTAADEDGLLIVTAINGFGPFTYSIDGGETFFSSNLFANLAAGTYEVVVRDANNCEATTEVTVEACDLEIMASVFDESGPNMSDGAVLVSAMNGFPPYSYSFEGGNFGADFEFDGLPAGTYQVAVQDSLGCERELEVIVDQIVSTQERFIGQQIEVFPNPTDGIFRLNVYGLQNEGTFLPIEIFDSAAKRIQTRSLTKYDNVYTGELSLTAYPAGIYYVKFNNTSIKRMVRIIKE
jgi:hypothetical protein